MKFERILCAVDFSPDSLEAFRVAADMTRLYDVTVIGVSNVGPITGGPWAGRKCIGCSLAMGPGGMILAEGPYGETAETLMCVDVTPRAPVARGTDFAAALQARGYRGAVVDSHS